LKLAVPKGLPRLGYSFNCKSFSTLAHVSGNTSPLVDRIMQRTTTQQRQQNHPGNLSRSESALPQGQWPFSKADSTLYRPIFVRALLDALTRPDSGSTGNGAHKTPQPHSTYTTPALKLPVWTTPQSGMKDLRFSVPAIAPLCYGILRNIQLPYSGHEDWILPRPTHSCLEATVVQSM
jgi:hypothetical protein